jgi:hypothetical protein
MHNFILLCPLRAAQVAADVQFTATLEFYDEMMDRKVWLGSIPGHVASSVKVRLQQMLERQT